MDNLALAYVVTFQNVFNSFIQYNKMILQLCDFILKASYCSWGLCCSFLALHSQGSHGLQDTYQRRTVMKQPTCFSTEKAQVKPDEPRIAVPPDEPRTAVPSANVSTTVVKPYSIKLRAAEDIESLYPKLSRNSRAQTADTVKVVRFYCKLMKPLNIILLGYLSFSNLITCILDQFFFALAIVFCQQSS